MVSIIPCVYTMCWYQVSTMCLYHVFVPYVCTRFVPCVCTMCSYHVFVASLYHVFVPYVCTICLYHMFIPYVCTICLYHMFVPCVGTKATVDQRVHTYHSYNKDMVFPADKKLAQG